MASGRTEVTQAFSYPGPRCLRPFAFAAPLGSPLQYTPWLLLREEGQDISPRNSLVSYGTHFLTFHSFHALSSRNHLVSDLFAPTRVGAFQLSLALLVRYRSPINV